MFGIGVQELGVIIVLALLVFGPKRMPELARLLGRGMGEFRKASNDLRESLALDEIQNEIRDAAGTIQKDLSGLTDDIKEDLVGQGIDKPDPSRPTEPDRPAQAGDDLPSPGAASGSASDPASDPARKASTEATAPRETHPGELPLGNDHEHHPEPEPSPPSDASASDAAPDSSDPERG